MYGQLRQKTVLPTQEGGIGLQLLVRRDGLGGDTVGDHAPLRLEARHRLRALYDHLLAAQDVAPVRPDVLEPVNGPALVLGALEGEAVPRARVPHDLEGHLLHLLPGGGGFGEAGLFEEILAVVEHPRVGEPRDAVDGALVDEGVHGCRQELLALALGEAVGDVQDPTVRGELGRPDHVPAYDVYLGGGGLQLGP
jgi:hypothetical protein